MEFTIETRTSNKSGKTFSALYCNGKLVGFVNRQVIDVELWKAKVKPDEISQTDFKVVIKN